MKISIKQYDIEALISLHAEDLSVDTVFAVLVVPALVAIGYSREAIAELFKDGDPMNWDVPLGTYRGE